MLRNAYARRNETCPHQRSGQHRDHTVDLRDADAASADTLRILLQKCKLWDGSLQHDAIDKKALRLTCARAGGLLGMSATRQRDGGQDAENRRRAPSISSPQDSTARRVQSKIIRYRHGIGLSHVLHVVIVNGRERQTTNTLLTHC